MLVIDGSLGEGGGQILRTALSLSLIGGRPFRIEHIRAGRKKPGLGHQHLAAVQAAAEIGQSEVEGAELGSQLLTFRPKTIRPGEYRFGLRTAGSATLVLQTVLPPLLSASGPSRLVLEGGTHNPWAPPFDFLEKTFFPLLNRMGPRVSAVLERPGFYPAGSGRFSVNLEPATIGKLELLDRGEIRAVRARALVANLPRHIAERELRVVSEKLRLPKKALRVEEIEGSSGPGNVLMVEVESQTITEVFTGFGERGVAAEKVAARAVQAVQRYLKAPVPVGEHLADQLLLPLALAGSGAFLTLPPSEHTKTNAEVLKKILEVEIQIRQVDEYSWLVKLTR